MNGVITRSGGMNLLKSKTRFKLEKTQVLAMRLTHEIENVVSGLLYQKLTPLI